MIRATNTADYEVYMITLTPSSDSRTTTVASNSNSAKTYTYDGTEKVVWVDDEANLGKFEDASLHADGYHVGGEATVPGLEITNRHAMLVTYLNSIIILLRLKLKRCLIKISICLRQKLMVLPA